MLHNQKPQYNVSCICEIAGPRRADAQDDRMIEHGSLPGVGRRVDPARELLQYLLHMVMCYKDTICGLHMGLVVTIPLVVFIQCLLCCSIIVILAQKARSSLEVICGAMDRPEPAALARDRF